MEDERVERLLAKVDAAAGVSLEELTREYAELKEQIAPTLKRLKELRDAIDPRLTDDYQDAFVMVKTRKALDLKDERLLSLLRKEKVLDRVSELVPRAPKVQAVALINDKIAAAVQAATKTQRTLTLTKGGDDGE